MILSFHHSQYALERLLDEKRETVTVVLTRLSAEGRLLDREHEPPVERPPFATLGVRA